MHVRNTFKASRAARSNGPTDSDASGETVGNSGKASKRPRLQADDRTKAKDLLATLQHRSGWEQERRQLEAQTVEPSLDNKVKREGSIFEHCFPENAEDSVTGFFHAQNYKNPQALEGLLRAGFTKYELHSMRDLSTSVIFDRFKVLLPHLSELPAQLESLSFAVASASAMHWAALEL